MNQKTGLEKLTEWYEKLYADDVYSKSPAASGLLIESLRICHKLLSADQSSKPVADKAYWWCPECKEEVDGSRVTFNELHDVCGRYVICKEPLTSKPVASDTEGLIKELKEWAIALREHETRTLFHKTVAMMIDLILERHQSGTRENGKDYKCPHCDFDGRFELACPSCGAFKGMPFPKQPELLAELKAHRYLESLPDKKEG